QELTDLGRIVAQLPVDPQLARLLLFGVTLKCFNPIVTLVAALSHRDPFILPTGEERSQALAVRDEFGKNDMSDHLMLLRAFDAYSAAGQKQWQFCRKKFLSPNTMKMIVGIRRQLLSELRRLRIVTSLSAFKDASLNRYSNCWPVVQAAIVAGCYPGIGMVKPGSRLRKIRTQTETNAMLHPGCVIKRQLMAPSRRAASALPPGQDPSMAMTDAEMANANLAEPSVAFVAYQELAKLEDCLTLRTVTAIPSVTVLLFAGSTKLDDKLVDTFDVYENSSDYGGNSDDEADEEEEEHRVVEIDSWLAFKGKFLDLQLLLKLRVKILAHFLRIMQQPSRNETPEDSALLALLAELLVSEHRKMGLAPVDDLPSLDYPQYCQPQYYNAAEHPASGYGGQSSAGPSWRSRGGRPGMNHSASWSTGGSGHSSSSSYSPGSFRPMRPYSSRGRGYSTTTFRRGSRGGGGGGGGQNNY
uniref:Helicase-associated domain-containing protein n=1 Tax=Plectus sambesii TaxID=2011161 RepID=A0A914XGH0_9BILA